MFLRRSMARFFGSPSWELEDHDGIGAHWHLKGWRVPRTAQGRTAGRGGTARRWHRAKKGKAVWLGVMSSEYPKGTVPNLLVSSLKWQFLHVPHFQTNSLGGLRSFRAECLPSDEKYSLHTHWVACDIPGEGSKVVPPRYNWKSLVYFFSLRCWKMFVIMDAGLSWHRGLYVLFVSFCIMFVHATNCISDVPMDVQYHEIYAIVRSRILHINRHHIHTHICYIYI